LADETIDLGLEFGSEEQIVGNGDISEVGGGTISPKAVPLPTRYSTTNRLFLCLFILR
jgi:hypothetical protein